MVLTKKFSEFSDADLTDSSNELVGLSGGTNAKSQKVTEWTTLTRPDPPFNGLMGFNTTTSAWEYYNEPDLEWQTFAALVNLGEAAFKDVTDNTKPLVASVTGSFTVGHVLIAADSAGTVADGGAPAGTGTVTSITAGTGLTGGVITTSGTIGLDVPVSLANGGTNASLTASNGGIVYSTATALAILSGTATASLPLLSGSSAAPSWGAFALNLGGALTTAGALTTTGAFSATFNFTADTNVTFPTSGTLLTSAGTITNADNIGITDDTTTNATMYPLWVTANTGYLPAKATSTKLSFNPSTGVLTATAFTGNWTNAAALTKVDDTNVTLSLGGSPTTALLAATSLTLGWTGQLSGARGGTGVNNGSNTATYAGNLDFASSFTTSGAFAVTQTYTGITNVTFPTSGTLATTSQIPTGAPLTKTDDTNVTLTLGGSPTTALVNATSLTLGWTGQLSVARGGTALASITAHNLIIGNGTGTPTLLAPSATSGIPLVSQGSSADPAYGTAVVSGGGTGNTTFTAYSVICAGTTATGAFQNVSGVGSTGQVLTSNGAGALPTWQNVSGTGTVNSGTANQLAYYATTGTAVSGLTSANNAGLLTNGSGVPAWVTATGTGAPVLATSPTLVTPTLGVATATSVQFSPSTGGIVGTQTNDNAGAGYVGQYGSASVAFASGVSLTNNTAANVTSISLPSAGDYDVTGNVAYNTSLLSTAWAHCITSTSATLLDTGFCSYSQITAGGNGNAIGSGIRTTRFSVSGATTVYLVAYCSFSSGTCTASGFISYRRVR